MKSKKKLQRLLIRRQGRRITMLKAELCDQKLLVDLKQDRIGVLEEHVKYLKVRLENLINEQSAK